MSMVSPNELLEAARRNTGIRTAEADLTAREKRILFAFFAWHIDRGIAEPALKLINMLYGWGISESETKEMLARIDLLKGKK